MGILGFSDLWLTTFIFFSHFAVFQYIHIFCGSGQRPLTVIAPESESYTAAHVQTMNNVCKSVLYVGATSSGNQILHRFTNSLLYHIPSLLSLLKILMLEALTYPRPAGNHRRNTTTQSSELIRVDSTAKLE